MLKVVAGIEIAAGHERVGGADRSGVSERHLYVVIIILLKERIFKDAEDVPPVVVPVFGYELPGNLFQLIGKTFFTGYAETVLQRRRNSVLMFVPIFPKVQTAGICPGACIRNIKHIFEFRIIAAGINQGDALGATADITPHLLVPEVIVGTGCCVWLLSENHKLLMERIFVEPPHRFEERRPFSEAARNLLGGLVCHLLIHLQFAWHELSALLYSIKLEHPKIGCPAHNTLLFCSKIDFIIVCVIFKVLKQIQRQLIDTDWDVKPFHLLFFTI